MRPDLKMDRLDLVSFSCLIYGVKNVFCNGFSRSTFLLTYLDSSLYKWTAIERSGKEGLANVQALLSIILNLNLKFGSLLRIGSGQTVRHPDLRLIFCLTTAPHNPLNISLF